MRITLLVIAVVVLAVLNVFIGAVDIPVRQILDVLTGNDKESVEAYIVMQSRLPMTITAILAGSGLAVAGLLLQTTFRNPLAGPSILGINSGASLGVAIVMLAMGGSMTLGSMSVGGYSAVLLGAFAGSIAVMGILLLLSTMLRNSLMLLITGIMVGYLASSVIMILNYVSGADSVRGYVMWGMSSFNGVTMSHIPLFATSVCVGLIAAIALMKPLNLLTLGDEYARNLGLNTGAVRNMLLGTTGLLSAVITAYCGPVSFIGLSVPHIARIVFPTDNHRKLLPAVMLTGAGIGLLCNLLCLVPGSSVLPLNAVTPLIGAPVVVWIIIKNSLKRG
ncbi:MAG: iron ABC transporter permease [Muribaculaceae bacterium]|nr:iron ABC transporter permease [Muribaculaceae bacterium]